MEANFAVVIAGRLCGEKMLQRIWEHLISSRQSQILTDAPISDRQGSLCRESLRESYALISTGLRWLRLPADFAI